MDWSFSNFGIVFPYKVQYSHIRRYTVYLLFSPYVLLLDVM